MLLPLVTTALIAFVATCLFTRLMQRCAPGLGLVDRPDATRKLHGGATPLGGGIAILLGVLTALALAVVAPHLPWLNRFSFPPYDDHTYLGTVLENPQVALHSNLVGLLVGALIISLVGVADDRFNLRGRQKLVGQIAAVLAVIGFGLVIEGIQLFGVHMQLGLLAVPFTMFWLLGAINALNLIDGADGMASTVGGIASLALAVMAYMSGYPVEALIALAVAAAIFAFLLFNFPPASIFLGDAGSMLIGLVIGVLAVRCSLKSPATVMLVAPVALLTVPILDSAAAVVRRRLTGRSIYETDRGHLHHCLLGRGLSNQGMLVCVALLCSVAAGGALLSVARLSELYAMFSVVAVVASLVLTRVFGYSELQLLVGRLLHLGTRLVPRSDSNGPRVRERSIQLQGVRQWQLIWQPLTEFAERRGLSSLRLDLNLAWLHEGFHGRWDCAQQPEAAQTWTMSVPVVMDDRTVGRLVLVGESSRQTADDLFPQLVALIRSLAPAVERLATAVPTDTSAGRAWHDILAFPTAAPAHKKRAA